MWEMGLRGAWRGEAPALWTRRWVSGLPKGPGFSSQRFPCALVGLSEEAWEGIVHGGGDKQAVVAA